MDRTRVGTGTSRLPRLGRRRLLAGLLLLVLGAAVGAGWIASRSGTPWARPPADVGGRTANPDEVVKVTSGDLTLLVQRNPWLIEGRLGDTPLFREQPGTPSDTHYGTLGYQRAGSSTWYHLAAVLEAEEIPGGQRIRVTTTEPRAGPALVEITAPLPGIARLAFRPPAGDPVVRTAAAAASDDTEMLLGLGERFAGVSLAGRRIDLWAADRRAENYGDTTYLPVPWLLSSRGYGFLLDDTRRSTWEMRSQRSDAWAVELPGPEFAYYLIAGQPAQAIERYTALTGRPPQPPSWGLGVVKTLVGGEARVLHDAARLRELDVPVDAVFVYDAVDDAANVGWPHVTYDPIPTGTYPDVRRLADSLHGLGFRLLGYFGPDFRPERHSFMQASNLGYLVRDTAGRTWVHPLYGVGLIDALNPQTVAWWQQGPLKRALVDLGFDGGMLDLGEAVPSEAQFADGRSGAEVHNAYPVAFTGAAQAALQAFQPDGLFLTRSGYTGGQQFHTATWSGDAVHTWAPVTGFQSMVPAALGAGLAGYAYWHTEVSGYVDGGLEPASERELYLRWLEFGAFTALLRDHYGDRRGQPTDMWTDGETIGLWRRYARIHQALRPYLWQAAREAQATGLPLLRHLAIAYPDDRRAWTEEQEYLLGTDLLVAPVIEFGARSRQVYLPAGEWVHWWTGAVYAGPGDVTVPAPLGQIPVFLRRGAPSPLTDPASFD